MIHTITKTCVKYTLTKYMNTLPVVNITKNKRYMLIIGI